MKDRTVLKQRIVDFYGGNSDTMSDKKFDEHHGCSDRQKLDLTTRKMCDLKYQQKSFNYLTPADQYEVLQSGKIVEENLGGSTWYVKKFSS